jgi:hypothetical protein
MSTKTFLLSKDRETKYGSENCKGCRFIREDLYCVLVEYEVIKDCPCTDCLVKMICIKQTSCGIRRCCMDYEVGTYRT